jgi:hypothetical protein
VQRVQPRPAATDGTALLIRTVEPIQRLGFTSSMQLAAIGATLRSVPGNLRSTTPSAER